MTLSAITVRRAGPADVETVSTFCRQEAALQERLDGYTLNPRFDWTGWARARLTVPHQFFYLAERENTSLGLIYGRRQAPPASRPRALLRRLLRRQSPIEVSGWAVIESCFVVESARRQGVGRQLATALLDEFSRHAVTRIAISVMAANATAVAFWNDLGFQTQRLQMTKSVDEINQIPASRWGISCA